MGTLGANLSTYSLSYTNRLPKLISFFFSLIFFQAFCLGNNEVPKTSEPLKKNPSTIYYFDNDLDGYGDPNNTIEAVSPPEGYVAIAGDCNDSNANINSAASEVCDALNTDEDCDGLSDNDDYFPEGQITFYLDIDSDGFGDASSPTLACDQPIGFVNNDDDCNDDDADINPVVPEVCDELNIDEDCDGLSDNDDYFPEGQLAWYKDHDADGYGNPDIQSQACDQPNTFVLDNTDCNDAISSINPGMTEVCNGIDNNCDGNEDEDLYNFYYQDLDGDGYGTSNTILACSLPEGYATNKDDCDDSNAIINPAGIEECNLLDDDCDEDIDEGFEQYTYFIDADGDFWGSNSETTLACTLPPGYSSNDSDCDDSNAVISPSGEEVCNEVDDNCDLLIDEGVQNTYYLDADEDFWGSDIELLACELPEGYSSNSDDCDDTNGSISPAGEEVCNETDDNCDGLIDDGVQNLYYEDLDGDGYGTNIQLAACLLPVGYADNNDDCNDDNPDINPGEDEKCDALNADEDCDGPADNNDMFPVGQLPFYLDNDNDGYGNAALETLACDTPIGFVSNDEDCNDSNASVKPSATEVCNNIDDDCDNLIDEGVLLSFYVDNDLDGYGSNTIILACTGGPGKVTNNNDCNDGNSAVKPGATEACNNIDDDCDNLIDEGVKLSFYVDNDLDGYGGNTIILACTGGPGKVTNHNDCNDNNAAVKPGAIEVCNNIDDDCDNKIDEGVQIKFYADNDADNLGDKNDKIKACVAPPGYVLNKDDNCPQDYNPNQYDIDDDGDGDVCDDELEYCEATDILIELIEDADLNNGLENSLINKLEQALDKFEDGKYNKAIDKLNAFISQVQSKSGNGIPVATANYWMYVAQQMINAINGGYADCDGNNRKNKISEVEIVNEGITVYPNPTNDFITIKSQDLINKITISQVTGASASILIDMAEEESNEANLDLNNYNLTSGLYIISIHSKSKIENLRLNYNK